MYFRLAITKLSLVLLCALSYIVAASISPVPREYIPEYRAYEGPHLDQQSGLIGINRGAGVYISDWDGQVLWGRRLKSPPIDPRPLRLEQDGLELLFSAAGKEAPLPIEDGWAISSAVLSPSALPGAPHLLAITRTRSFDAAGMSLPTQDYLAELYDAESGELVAELALPQMFQELSGRQPEQPFIARLDCAAGGGDGMSALNLFFSSGYVYQPLAGLWDERGFTLLALSGRNLRESALLRGPGGRTLWIEEGHCELFDVAGQRLPTADMASWQAVRARLLPRLLAVLGICALFSAVLVAAVGLALAGIRRPMSPA